MPHGGLAHPQRLLFKAFLTPERTRPPLTAGTALPRMDSASAALCLHWSPPPVPQTPSQASSPCRYSLGNPVSGGDQRPDPSLLAINLPRDVGCLIDPPEPRRSPDQSPRTRTTVSHQVRLLNTNLFFFKVRISHCSRGDLGTRLGVDL